MMKQLLLLIGMILVNPMLSNAGIIKYEKEGICYNINLDSLISEVTFRGDDYLFLESEYSGDVIIPDSIVYDNKVYRVTGIGEGAFYYCNSLKSVVLPKYVSYIGDYAFSGCINIHTLSFPAELKKIGRYAFRNCSSIDNIELASSLMNLEEGAFLGCSNLKTIELNEGLSTIGKNSFKDCANLQSLYIPSSVNTIEESSFEGCTKLKEIIIGEGLKTIEPSSFKNCKSFEYINIPASVQNVGDEVFSGCEQLKKVDGLSGTLSVGSSAFFECVRLEDVSFPEGIKKINNSTFSGCLNLRHFVIPSTVTSIGNSAFTGCPLLTEIELPEGLTLVGVGAFDGCCSMGRIKLPKTLLYIQSWSFNNCGLTKIEIPKNVISVGGAAFWDNKLESVLLNNVQTSVADNAFSDLTMQHAILYVPVGSWLEAVYDSNWNVFNHIYESASTTRELSYNKKYLIMNASSSDFLFFDKTNDKVSQTDKLGDIEKEQLLCYWHLGLNADGTSSLRIRENGYLTVSGDGYFTLSNSPMRLYLFDSEDGILFNDYKENAWRFIEVESMKSTTRITNVKHFPNNKNEFYSIDGKTKGSQSKGIVIVRDENGNFRKEYRK